VVEVGAGLEDRVDGLEPLVEQLQAVVGVRRRAGVHQLEQLHAFLRAEVEAQVQLDIEGCVSCQQLPLVSFPQFCELAET
jgi:hypothetical protein